MQARSRASSALYLKHLAALRIIDPHCCRGSERSQGRTQILTRHTDARSA